MQEGEILQKSKKNDRPIIQRDVEDRRMLIGEKTQLTMRFLLSIFDDRKIEGQIGVIGDESTVAQKSRTGCFHSDANRLVFLSLEVPSKQFHVREVHRHIELRRVELNLAEPLIQLKMNSTGVFIDKTDVPQRPTVGHRCRVNRQIQKICIRNLQRIERRAT